MGSKILANSQLSMGIQYPRLKCQVSFYSDGIVLSKSSYHYHLQNQAGLQKLLLMMDGTHQIQDLQQLFSPSSPEIIQTLIQQLAIQGFIEEGHTKTVDFRQNSILKWEELFIETLSKKLQQQPLQPLAASPPSNLIYGFALEHYHLFNHQSDVYAPLLHLQNTSKVRQSINRFYCEINEQDELLFQGLQGLGIDRDDLLSTLPLPETLAFCHALSFWANSDPLFCLSLLAVWEIQQIQVWKSYLELLENHEVDSLFLATIQQLIRVKCKAQPERFKHLIISELSPFEDSTLGRFQRQIHLFVELYQNFYTAIGRFYQTSPSLLRLITAI